MGDEQLGGLGQVAQQSRIGPQQVVGGDMLAQLNQKIMERAGRTLEAGPPPMQSPETIEAMQKYMQGMQQPVDPSAKWWKMAAAFMSPTKTGQSSEGLAAGFGAYGEGLAAEQLANRQGMNAAQLYAAQQSAARDKQAADLYDKSEKHVMDWAAKQQATKGGKGTILDKAVNAANKYVEMYGKSWTPAQYRQEWQNTYNQNLEIMLDAWATQNNLSETDKDKARNELLKSSSNMFKQAQAAQPAEPTQQAPSAQPSDEKTNIKNTEGGVTVDLQNMRPSEVGASMRNMRAQDALAMLGVMPPEQRAQVERWVRQGAIAKARGNTQLAERRGAQIQSMIPTTTPIEAEVEKQRQIAQAKEDIEVAAARKKESEKKVGAAEGERTGALPEEINRLRAATTGLTEWKNVVNEALNHPGLSKVVGAEGYIPLRGRVATASGTDAANFKALMTPLLAKTAFAELQAMREASKTGGALGSITERELDRLENAIAALSLEQDPEQFKRQLGKVSAHIDSIQNNLKAAHSTKYGKPGFDIKQRPTSAGGFSIKERRQ